VNLHEYQGKQLFAEFGLPVSKHEVVFNADEAIQACNKIGGKKWVVKAQVHAGGRGKAGGVKLIESPEEARDFADQWLGKRLKTYQTDENGQLVSAILIESCTDIDKELYLSAVIDRSSQSVTFIASSEGGVNIEEVASKTPEKIIYENVDPLTGPQPFQARRISSVLGLDSDQAKQFSGMFQNFVKLFNELDLSLLEVNPLVINSEGKLHCLDAKINLDSNALYRHPSLVEMQDPTQEDPRESEAAKHDLSYVSLDGNIGCMVNGAGLAMGTMDTIKYFGGAPANFLDVGGTATQERVSNAFKIILADPEVKVVLVNIFGGIVRCDLIAEGIVAAIKDVGVNVPVVVRLEGNNAELGSQILADSGVEVESLNDLESAAKKSVELAK
jgi:succinyl-CoA synthetase beta subunit